MKNLTFNKQYKYKELQEIFGIADKSGEQTIRDISKFYKIEKVRRGTYVVVRELTPLEKAEMTTYNKNREYLEPMIYSMLLTEKSNSIIMDMHELMEAVEIVNKDFHYIKYHIAECGELLDLDNKTSLSLFTKESEPMLKRIVRDILYDMADKQLIKITEIPVVAYKIYDLDSKRWFTRTEELTEIQQIQKLLEIKRTVLKRDYGLERETELSFYQMSEFRDLVAKEYGASYFYYKYEIVLNKEGLTLCEKGDIKKLKESFNSYIREKMSKSKQGDLKVLTKQEKDICVKYCIDTRTDFKLRERKS